MAGDWIKMRKNLPSDPRVVRMMSALKADRFRTVGGLMSAWCLADDHSEDGTLDGYTPDLLDEILGFPGLAAAMMRVGWLEFDGESLVFPRFSEHNGRTAKRRAQDSVRKVSAREADKKRTREEKRREEKNTLSLSRPKQFQTEDFGRAWARWKSHRAEQLRPLRGHQEEQQLYKLADFSEPEAIAIIDFSIQRGAVNLICNGDHSEKPKALAGERGFAW